jgi:hypothetical protein
MTDAFEKFVKDNPEMMERTRKPYYEKTEERIAQWTLALEKIDEGYPRKVVIKWLQQECEWDLAYKTISDYIGNHIDGSE